MTQIFLRGIILSHRFHRYTQIFLGTFFKSRRFRRWRRFLFAYSLALIFVLLLLFLFDSEQVLQTVEVFLHDETEALCVKTVTGKVTVVCLVVHSDSQITIWENEVSHVKITDETLCGIRIVAIAKLTIEQQAVIEQLATQDTLILGIIEAFVTRRNICTEIPVVTLYDIGKYSVYLL
mgnify:CR=1 FL=1